MCAHICYTYRKIILLTETDKIQNKESQRYEWLWLFTVRVLFVSMGPGDRKIMAFHKYESTNAWFPRILAVRLQCSSENTSEKTPCLDRYKVCDHRWPEEDIGLTTPTKDRRPKEWITRLILNQWVVRNHQRSSARHVDFMPPSDDFPGLQN